MVSLTRQVQWDIKHFPEVNRVGGPKMIDLTQVRQGYTIFEGYTRQRVFTLHLKINSEMRLWYTEETLTLTSWTMTITSASLPDR